MTGFYYKLGKIPISLKVWNGINNHVLDLKFTYFHWKYCFEFLLLMNFFPTISCVCKNGRFESKMLFWSSKWSGTDSARVDLRSNSVHTDKRVDGASSTSKENPLTRLDVFLATITSVLFEYREQDFMLSLALKITP